MNHVEKGCLTRPHQDVKSDGSRVEAYHRALNAIMRTYTCGLELYLGLTHDFVLRRNIRVAMKFRPEERTDFVNLTSGSHHLGLVDRIARRWNQISSGLDQKGVGKGKSVVRVELPVLIDVPSREAFGLVRSRHNESFGGRLEIAEPQSKQEEEEDVLDEELPSLHQGISAAQVMREMNIDPTLLLLPEAALGKTDKGEPEDVPKTPQETVSPGSEPPHVPKSPDASGEPELRPEVIVSSLLTKQGRCLLTD